MNLNKHIYDCNLKCLNERNPVLANSVMAQKNTDQYNVAYSKTGHPVLKTTNNSFHSLHDPVTEGCGFVKSNMERNCSKGNRKIAVFGFGFAYHLQVMLDKNIDVIVIEPRIEILRLAMEHIDLVGIIDKFEIITDVNQACLIVSDAQLWVHQPSARNSQYDFNRIKKASKRQNKYCVSHLPPREKSSLKILVVTPIYGGSLPIAKYCFRALQNMGHDVQLWDSSIFDLPFRKALDLNLDMKNKKTLHDLFMHLISEMIVATCTEFRPDMVLVLAQAPLSVKAIQRLRKSSITTAFWFVEDYQIMPYWQEYAPHYDLFFTIQENEFTLELDAAGVRNHHYLPLAADTKIHCPRTLTVQEMNKFGCDISFMGAGYYNRQQFFKGLLDFDFKIWGTDWQGDLLPPRFLQGEGKRISTEDTVKIFNASSINLNLHSSVCHEGVDPFGDFVNPRTFEISSCGGFQLVDYRSMIDRHFEIGKELICFSSLEDLRDKIVYYQKNSVERTRVAELTRQRTIKEHTYMHRMEDLIAFSKKRIPECFYKKSNGVPVIKDATAFCEEHPEVTPILNLAGGNGSPDLDMILSVIDSGSGPRQYHEAIFLLINNFRELFMESAQ